MINPDLLKYIKEESSKNVTKDIIQANLLSAGWNESDIKEAIIFIETGVSTTNSLIKEDFSIIKKHHFNISIIASIIICILWSFIVANSVHGFLSEVVVLADLVITIPFVFFFSTKIIDSILKPTVLKSEEKEKNKNNHQSLNILFYTVITSIITLIILNVFIF